MTKNNLLYCATDKEIYDVLMSAKQRINAAVVLELAKDRGIFYSSKDARETLVHNLSLLTHDYHDLNIILDQREHAGRAEKTTSITLNAALTVEEIKEVAKEYIAEAPPGEKVTSYSKGTDQYVISVKYSEIDYGKTRLVQRTSKEAGIEFHIEGDKTIIRMPANAKSKEIVGNLKNRLDGKKKVDIQADSIEISEFSTAAQKTQFFTSLITTLKGFKLDNVTSVKVEPLKKEPEEDEIDLEDDQNKEEAKQEALALVRNVALKGESLLASEEYQSLQKKGFFITSIIWRSKQTSIPYPIVEFEAAFEEPEAGKGFKYSIRGALNFIEADVDYTKTLRPIEVEEKQKLLSLIEQTASAVIAKIRAENDATIATVEIEP
jgi:acylphosphatase